MISVEGMNNIINGLYFDNRLKEYYPDLYREQNLETDDDFYKLARKLFLLNQHALIQRYGKTFPNYFDIPIFSWNNKPVNKFQFLKSVECLIYQCSEGNTINKKLFKWLTKLEQSLRGCIIEDIEDYKKAKWD